LDSWFIKFLKLKTECSTKRNHQLEAKSDWRRTFWEWLKNANDWNLSRSRFWGIPLPIWRTEDKQEEILIGSVEELYNEIENRLLQVSKENPFKGFEMEIWPNQLRFS
jgi:isoleucyl-tRNA synthetase